MAETAGGGPEQAGAPEWLPGEVDSWVREGLIGPDAADLILARYGLLEGNESPRSLRQTRIAQIVGTVGAVLVGVGILVVVGANWEAIPRLARIALLLFSMLGFYASGYWMAHGGGGYPGFGKALILAGSLVWVSSIFLVAQMFHLGGNEDPEYARGLLYAFLGLLPLAYALRSPLQLAAALITGCGWAVVSGESWGLRLTGLWMLLLLLGALLYAVGLAHRRLQSLTALAATYGKFGIGLTALALFATTFTGWMDASLPGPVGGALVALYTSIGVAALAAAFWYAVWAKRAGDRTGVAEAAGCAAVAILAAATLALLLSHASQPTALYLKLTANVLLLVLEMGCIWLGWNRAAPGLINAGLAFFFIHLMTRYFDLVAAMLPGGMAFIGAGLLLLLAAFSLERQRRRLLHTMPPGPAFPKGGVA